MRRLTQRVATTLVGKIKPHDRVALALSGGNDSLALLYLLIEFRKKTPFFLELAHVDHRWRPESGRDAAQLRALALHLKLPFHLHVASSIGKCDRENHARKERLAFFARLSAQRGYRAVILAHHADDQAETVLKRLGEGAGLRGLGGLVGERLIDGVVFYRPLLETKKEELVAYLKELQVVPLADPTNSDCLYLRARMRKQVFPLFERSFGKKVAHHFTAFGHLWQEVQGYLDKKVEALHRRAFKGPLGTYFYTEPNDEELELKWILLRYAATKNGNLSRTALERLVGLIRARASKAFIQAPPLVFIVNGAHLFITSQEISRRLSPPTHWKVIERKKRKGWRDFWQGELYFPTPPRQLLSLTELNPKLRKKLKERYRKHHVPVFLHDKAPLFKENGQIISSCLTDKPIAVAL